ncbi:MAG: hypothetical protein QXH37_07565 [Candidatus Bathyarchaeia archaeon]
MNRGLRDDANANARCKVTKHRVKRKPHPSDRPLTGYFEDENKSDFAQETTLTQAKEPDVQENKQIEEENSLLAEVKRLQGEFTRLREEFKLFKLVVADARRRNTSVAGVQYRKNKRVIYIPKQQLYDKVLDRLRQRADEPIRITIKKVFEVAAKFLGVTLEHEQ